MFKKWQPKKTINIINDFKRINIKLFFMLYLINLSSIKVPIISDKATPQNSKITKLSKLLFIKSFIKKHNKNKQKAPMIAPKILLDFRLTLTNLKIK